MDEGAPQGPEKLSEAAVRYRGEVRVGAIHPDAVRKLIAEIPGLTNGDVEREGEFGYMTTIERFVTEDEANALRTPPSEPYEPV